MCSWRNANEQAINMCFVQVLKLARELKLLKLGTIAIDGTHIRASASKNKNLTYGSVPSNWKPCLSKTSKR